MGSYVLVSLQSQTCSSHCAESCITTRTPWLGVTCSPRVGEIRVQPKPAQQVQIKGAVAKWSGECLYVKRFETGMQYTGSSYREQVSRLCRRMWVDKKAEREMLI